MDTSRIIKYFSLDYYKSLRKYKLIIAGLFVLGYLVSKIEYCKYIGFFIVICAVLSILALVDGKIRDSEIDRAAEYSRTNIENGKFILQHYKLIDGQPFMKGKDLIVRTPDFVKATFDFSHKEYFVVDVVERNIITDETFKNKYRFYFTNVSYRNEIITVENEYGRANMVNFVLSDDEKSINIPINITDSTVDKIISYIDAPEYHDINKI